jgi:hypothetical protein
MYVLAYRYSDNAPSLRIETMHQGGLDNRAL